MKVISIAKENASITFHLLISVPFNQKIIRLFENCRV